MSDIVERLRGTTRRMAFLCSVDMGLWNDHSNACLGAAAEIERLRALNAEMREALRESLHYFEFYGCPICGGDCPPTSRPVTGCPIHAARAALSHPTPDGCGREGGEDE